MNNKEYLKKLVNNIIAETLADKANDVMGKIKRDHMSEGEICECGSPMVEGECLECGKMSGEVMEKLYGKQRKLDKNKNGRLDRYDFKQLRGEMKEKECMECGNKGEYMEGNVCECGSSEFYEGQCVECGMKKGDILEFGSSQNFTAGMDEEVEEGNAFSGAREKAIDAGKKSFKVDGKTYPVKGDLDETLYRLVDGKESALFTENEIIDIIEGIVNEEKKKDNIKKGVQPKGLSAYEKAHKGSGKENKEYLDSVAKKLTDYLKDGSKGKYETNPKHFPKGNGQLAKMSAKKYTMSDDGKEFLDDFTHPGMEDLVPDEVQYDNKWMDDNIAGSSRTGNNPEWANAEETELGERINKKRKEQKYHKAKMTAYRKSKQPVTDGVGENGGNGIKIKTESVENKKLNEEFSRIQQLMGYNQKTQ